MVREKTNMTNKIIIPKKNGSALSEESRKKLLEDLQNITPEEIEAIGKEIEEKLKEEELEEFTDFDKIWNPVEICWIPAFRARKHGKARKYRKQFIMRWKEKYSDDFDEVWDLVEINWKPAFVAKNGEKWFIMRWKEKYSADFDEVWIPEEIDWKIAYMARKGDTWYKIWYDSNN